MVKAFPGFPRKRLGNVPLAFPHGSKFDVQPSLATGQNMKLSVLQVDFVVVMSWLIPFESFYITALYPVPSLGRRSTVVDSQVRVHGINGQLPEFRHE